MRIEPPLFWNENNVNHLMHSHHVTPDEVEEVVFGIEGEEPSYRIRRQSDDQYLVFGETGGNRLLKMACERLENGQWRFFHAQDMNDREKKRYREG